jgi:hypothetical protein
MPVKKVIRAKRHLLDRAERILDEMDLSSRRDRRIRQGLSFIADRLGLRKGTEQNLDCGTRVSAKAILLFPVLAGCLPSLASHRPPLHELRSDRNLR